MNIVVQIHILAALPGLREIAYCVSWLILATDSPISKAIGQHQGSPLSFARQSSLRRHLLGLEKSIWDGQIELMGCR